MKEIRRDDFIFIFLLGWRDYLRVNKFKKYYKKKNLPHKSMEWLPIQTSPKKKFQMPLEHMDLTFSQAHEKRKIKLTPKKKSCWGLDRNFILCEETSQHSLNQTSKMMIRQTGANSNLVGHKQSRAVW